MDATKDEGQGPTKDTDQDPTKDEDSYPRKDEDLDPRKDKASDPAKDEDPVPTKDEGPDPQTMCTSFLFIIYCTNCDLFGQIPRRAALGGSTKLQRLKDQKSKSPKSNNRIEIPALALSVATSIIVPIVSKTLLHKNLLLSSVLFGRFI